MAPKFKIPTAFALFILLLLPLSYGIGTPGFLTADSAFGLSTKANPVGTNLIVEIAKKQNPAVVFVTSKIKFQPAKGNAPGLLDSLLLHLREDLLLLHPSRGTEPERDSLSIGKDTF